MKFLFIFLFTLMFFGHLSGITFLNSEDGKIRTDKHADLSNSNINIKSNLKLHEKYQIQKRNKEIKLLRRKLKKLIAFSKELSIGMAFGINHGLFRVFTELVDIIYIVSNPAEDMIIDVIELIRKNFYDEYTTCKITYQKRPKHFNKLLKYLDQNKEVYPCLTNTLKGLHQTFLEKGNKVKCWNNYEVFYKNIIQRYLRSVCREEAKEQINPLYFKCCTQTMSYYVEDLKLDDVSIDTILDFNVVKSCINPDPNRMYKEITNVDSNFVGFSCLSYPEYNNNSTPLTENEKIEIHIILNNQEEKCNLTVGVPFINTPTLLGFMFSVMFSILLFYFRF